jgi:predicted  nucleic acid-binding Zn-ribbon protein
MNPDLEKLKALDEVDREIQRLNEEVAALPLRVAAIEDKLAGIKAEIESHQAGIKQGESARRKLETDIQSQQQKISKYRDQSLDVKTNEQYKALMHEIGFAEAEIRLSEDNILERMLEGEGHETALKTSQAEFRAQEVAVQKEKDEAHQRTQQDQKELGEWSAKRDRLRGGITPEVMAHYDRVRPARKTALAEARDQKCSACNVVLRPQTYDEVRSNQRIIVCDSCQRFLYYDPAHEPEVTKPKSKRKYAADADAEAAAADAVNGADPAAEVAGPQTDEAPVVR